MTITIRRAVPSDVSAILDMVVALAVYERMPDAVKATEESLARTLFGPDPRVFVHVADQDGKAVGIALWFLTYSTWTGKPSLYLEDLFVAPDARGKGVGKALLVRLAQLALERDCARLEWWVLDWNTPAIDFYRSIGARPMDEWTVQRVDGEALIALAGQESAHGRQ